MPVEEKSKFKKSYSRGGTLGKKINKLLFNKSWKTNLSFKKILFNLWKPIPVKLSKMWRKNMRIEMLSSAYIN